MARSSDTARPGGAGQGQGGEGQDGEECKAAVHGRFLRFPWWGNEYIMLGGGANGQSQRNSNLRLDSPCCVRLNPKENLSRE